MTLDAIFQLIVSTGCALAMFGLILNFAALMTWVERKLSAMIQDRIGPNRANIRLGRYNFRLIGLVHIIADPVKLFFKEDFVPAGANKVLHTLAPAIALVVPLLAFVVIPFAGPWQIGLKHDIPATDIWGLGYFIRNDAWLLSDVARIWANDALHLSDYTLKFVVADLEVGMLFVFGIASLAVYGVILAGFSSNNKFSFLGAMRGANQMISYEVALGLSAVGLFMIHGGVSMSELVAGQGELWWGVVPKWGIVTQPVAFLLFVVCGIAEIKRTPFDLPEGESEIVAGYFLEYSSTKFTMFMFGEFVEMILLSAVVVTLFFGGWQVPGLSASGLHWWFLSLDWTPNNLNGFLVSLVQGAKFTVALVVALYAIFMVRWTFPRFRYDQLMKLGWKMILPLAIANVLVTGVVLAFTRGWL